MSLRDNNIAPYPQHMAGILGSIEKYHTKDSWLQKFFKKSEKGVPWPPRLPSKSAHGHGHCLDHAYYLGDTKLCSGSKSSTSVGVLLRQVSLYFIVR